MNKTHKDRLEELIKMWGIVPNKEYKEWKCYPDPGFDHKWHPWSPQDNYEPEPKEETLDEILGV